MVGITKDYIYEAAMAEIGDQAVISNNQGSRNELAKFLDKVYHRCLCDILYQHDWTCSIVEGPLSKDVNPGEFGFSYKYRLPNDCLNVNFLFYLNNYSSNSSNIKASLSRYDGIVKELIFKVANRFVHTNCESLTNICYKKIIEPNEMTIDFANCLITKLSMVLAKRFKPTLYGVLQNEFKEYLSTGIFNDASNSEIANNDISPLIRKYY